MAGAALILVFAAAAIAMVRFAARSVRDYLAVLGGAAFLVQPFYSKLTGDISVLIPVLEPKDDIVLVSAASTILWPLFTAALLVWMMKTIVRLCRRCAAC